MGFELAMKANHAYSISIASFGLAQGLIRQGRFTDAIRVLEQGCEQTKLHTIEAAVDQVVSRLIYAYSRAGRMEEARKLEETMSPELARFSFLSSTHFSLAAMGLESDRIDATLQAAHEVHRTANHSRWSATSASVLSLGGKAARMKQNRSFNRLSNWRRKWASCRQPTRRASNCRRH
jgi:hypothetical protein